MPPGDELAALLAKAERDCFVGASLKPSPSYRWTRERQRSLRPLERRHRQAMTLELLPVVLRDFLVA